VTVLSVIAVRVFLPAVIALAMTAACVFAADITGTLAVKQRQIRPGVAARC
jgi:hypothetical protein